MEKNFNWRGGLDSTRFQLSSGRYFLAGADCSILAGDAVTVAIMCAAFCSLLLLAALQYSLLVVVVVVVVVAVILHPAPTFRFRNTKKNLRRPSTMSSSRIEYSEKYADEENEYRYVSRMVVFSGGGGGGGGVWR